VSLASSVSEEVVPPVSLVCVDVLEDASDVLEELVGPDVCDALASAEESVVAASLVESTDDVPGVCPASEPSLEPSAPTPSTGSTPHPRTSRQTSKHRIMGNGTTVGTLVDHHQSSSSAYRNGRQCCPAVKVPALKDGAPTSRDVVVVVVVVVDVDGRRRGRSSTGTTTVQQVHVGKRATCPVVATTNSSQRRRHLRLVDTADAAPTVASARCVTRGDTLIAYSVAGRRSPRGACSSSYVLGAELVTSPTTKT
jgi:hypothetical protein